MKKKEITILNDFENVEDEMFRYAITAVDTSSNNQNLKLKNFERNSDLKVYNIYTLFEYEEKFWVLLSFTGYQWAKVFGPFAKKKDAEDAAQKDFDAVCEVAKEMEARTKEMEDLSDKFNETHANGTAWWLRWWLKNDKYK